MELIRACAIAMFLKMEVSIISLAPPTLFGIGKKKKNPGIKIYSSDDLLNWKFEKLLIDRSKLDTTVWYLDRF